jgi:hypothetical protein
MVIKIAGPSSSKFGPSAFFTLLGVISETGISHGLATHIEAGVSRTQ